MIKNIGIAALGISLVAGGGYFLSKSLNKAINRMQPVPLTCVESRQEYDALRMCMQTESTTGCTMEIEDFSRRAELEIRLTECE